jgi:acetoin utilization protein AcuB
MLVKDWMSKKVITIEEEASIQDVMRLMKRNNIYRLPVMKKEKLVGIITDRDVRSASTSDGISLDAYEFLHLIQKRKVKDVMTKNPITIPLDYTVEEAALIFFDNHISGAPVVNRNGDVIGIITQTDLFRVLISLTGIGESDIQFALELEDRPGSIKEITDIIREKGGQLVSILTSYDRVPAGYRNVYIRAYGIDRDSFNQTKRQLQDKARMLYMIDHARNKREIY